MSTHLPMLVCNVVLPEEWRATFHTFAGFEGEKRHFTRKPLRVLAAMQHVAWPLSLSRSNQWYGVYVKDVSHGGIGFLHSEQIFPTEEVRIVLPDTLAERALVAPGSRTVRVMRCQRLQTQCYLVGGAFTDSR